MHIQYIYICKIGGIYSVDHRSTSNFGGFYRMSWTYRMGGFESRLQNIPVTHSPHLSFQHFFAPHIRIVSSPPPSPPPSLTSRVSLGHIHTRERLIDGIRFHSTKPQSGEKKKRLCARREGEPRTRTFVEKNKIKIAPR